MVEGARLESVYTVKRIVGSNPILSANKRQKTKYKLPQPTMNQIPFNLNKLRISKRIKKKREPGNYREESR